MRVLALLLVVAAMPGLTACSKDAAPVPDAGVKIDTVQPGQHLIEFVQYNDTNDIYRVFLVGRPDKNEPQRLTNVRLAHISDADVKAGKKPHLTDDGNGPILWLGTNFKIGYMHGVIEEQVDAAVGTKTNVLIRMEKRVWAPFQTANALGGAEVFGTPAYYFAPPVTDGILVGIGGMGPTRETAYEAFRVTHSALPQPVKLAIEGFQELKKEPPTDGGTLVATGPDGGPAVRAATTPRRVIGVVPGSPAARRQLWKKQQALKAVQQNKGGKGGKPGQPGQPGQLGQQKPGGKQLRQPPTTNKQPAPAVQKQP